MIKRKRRHRRRKNAPYGEDARFQVAHTNLIQQAGVRLGPGAKRSSFKLTLLRLGENRWRVSGGENTHIVTWDGTTARCEDRSSHRIPPRDGFACSHELALYRLLANDHIHDLFDSRGYKRQIINAATVSCACG